MRFQCEGRNRIFFSWWLTLGLENKPFYSCVLSCQSLNLEWGWRWPCFDRDQYLVSITTRQFTSDSSKICIITRSPFASLLIKGLATKHATVKWTVDGMEIIKKYYNTNNNKKSIGKWWTICWLDLSDYVYQILSPSLVCDHQQCGDRFWSCLMLSHTNRMQTLTS